MTKQLIFSDPSVDGPNMRLGNGTGGEFTGTSTMNGDVSSGWDEVQWMGSSYFQPGGFSTTHKDNELGMALGYWSQGSSNIAKGNSSYSVYGTKGNYVYQMQAQGGDLNDVLIQNKGQISPGVYTFNHGITFTAKEGLSNVSGNTGVYQAGNNFIVSYNYNGIREDFFLQIQVADNRGHPQAYSTVSASNIFGSIYNVTGVGTTDYFTWSNTGGLKDVTINLNAAVLNLAKTVFANTNLGSSVMDMSNWSLLSSYFGVESGNLGNISSSNATANFNVSNIQVTYDTSVNFSSADDGQKVMTIDNGPQQAMEARINTANNANANIILNPESGVNSQNLISSGYWDNVNINKYKLVAYVNKGSAFSSNGGSLTLSGPGSTYISGQYNGLYATLNASSNTNALLTGYSNIQNNGSTLSLTGQGAYATINGYGANTIVGTYNSLNLNISQGNVYAGLNYTGNINNKQSNILNNGANVNLNVSGYLGVYTSAGQSNINGTNLNNAKIDVYGNNTNLTGNWLSVNGTIEASSSVNIAVTSANIFNNGGNVTLVGQGGSLNINGTGRESIYGSWADTKATIYANQHFNAIVGDKSFLTVNSGADASIWAQTGSVSVNVNGGNSILTPGSGYLSANIDMTSGATVKLKDFVQDRELIMMTKGSGFTSSYNEATNITTISAGNSSINIDGRNAVSGVSSVGNTNFSSMTGQTDTLALLISKY